MSHEIDGVRKEEDKLTAVAVRILSSSSFIIPMKFHKFGNYGKFLCVLEFGLAGNSRKVGLEVVDD